MQTFLAVLVLVSCGSAPADPIVQPPVEQSPPVEGKNFPDQTGACKSTEGPSRFDCEWDSDCMICHDGSNCGVVVNREEHAKRGAKCDKEDAAECESSRARCCGGKCTVASY